MAGAFKFQFQYGLIKSPDAYNAAVAATNFNSNMV